MPEWLWIHHHVSGTTSAGTCLKKSTLMSYCQNQNLASAKIKTDKLDAVKLVDLLRGGYIAECYMPDKKTMDLRELVRHRAALVRMRTKLKNKIHGILLMKGITFPGIRPFTRACVEKLKGLGDYSKINGYLNVIESLDSEIKDVFRKILQLANEDEMASQPADDHTWHWILFCIADCKRGRRHKQVPRFASPMCLCRTGTFNT